VIPTAEEAARVLAHQKAFNKKTRREAYERAAKHLTEHGTEHWSSSFPSVDDVLKYVGIIKEPLKRTRSEESHHSSADEALEVYVKGIEYQQSQQVAPDPLKDIRI
jgi:hypothetical protein